MDISENFQDKIVNQKKLLKYGFVKVENGYRFEKYINNNDFLMTVLIDENEKFMAKVVDICTEDEYTLHLSDVAVAKGAFVAKIRGEYDSILEDILKNCYDLDNNIFKEITSKKIIKYIKSKYNDELEFLWKKSPNNAVVRRKDSAKWYAVFMTLSKNKLGFASNKIVEILNLHLKPQKAEELIMTGRYFPAYHMNKNHWISIILDENTDFAELCMFLDESYTLAKR